MSFISWDPLANLHSRAFVDSTIKLQIKNILKSYTGWYDPLAELIQNALDAIEHRNKLERKYKGELWISIDMKNQTISVTDNGIGFTEEHFKNFLAPNVSFKSYNERGNKGVGATYLAYGFNYLQIGTKTKDYNSIGSINSGREWVEDEKDKIARPEIEKSKLIHAPFNNIDKGSTFSLKLIGEYIRPKNLNWVNADTADQWETILRIKTPLGGIYMSRTKPKLKCNLSVTDQFGNLTQNLIENCEYIYPHTVITSCKELKEIREHQAKQLSKGMDISKTPDKFSRLNGLFNFWSNEDILQSDDFSKLKESEIELVKKHQISLYAFFGFSTDLWDSYNDGIAKLRKGSRILKGGIQLATNGMPQGELLIIPLTKNIGYQNVTHVITHFENADPDLGRKGFQPELEELAQTLGTATVKIFQNWRRHLRTDTGAPPDILGEKNIYEWIKKQEEHEKNHPLRIYRQDIFLPTKEPSMTSDPLNEQDVVALFNQLLAGGVIRGIKIMSSSQHNQYDGIFKFYLQKPIENHIYNKINNPLGIEENHVTEEYSSQPKILEYKYSVDSLLEEFEKEEKFEKDIELVIAWIMGKEWKKRYEVIPLLHFDNIQHRYFHGGSHIIKSVTTNDRKFPAIILSELIDFINDPDSVQEYQAKEYIDN